MTPGTVGAACDGGGCTSLQYHRLPEAYIDAGEQGLARDPYVGIRVEDFLLVRKLGQGGFGAVYMALQLPILMKTAVKLLRTLGENPEEAAAARQNFESEARALARLHHPNIVRLNKYGLVGDVPYLAMEYVRDGRELRELIARRHQTGFSYAEIRHLVGQLLRALSAAHEENVIHRDIKPANMMVQEIKGDPLYLRVLDFGLVKFFSESPETTLARGTPLYMAPEQLQGRNIGPWTDVYAAGLVLYELLTGRRPFVFQPRDLLYSRKLDRHYSVLNEPEAAQIPEPIQAVIRQATRVEPADRYQTAEMFQEAIDAAFEGWCEDRDTVRAVSGDEATVAAGVPTSLPAPRPPRGRRRLWLALLGIVAAVLLGAGGMYLWDRTSAAEDIRISEATIGDQQLPALARLSDGTLVAAWDSGHPEAERKDVYLRTLTGDGAPSGAPIRVNTTLEGDQEMPSLGALTGGGLAVVWTSGGQDGDSWGLFGQVFDASMGRTSDEFPVNLEWTRGEQSQPVVLPLEAGDFVVVWQSRDADGDDFGIVAQRFSPAGARIGPEAVLNVQSEGPQRFPAAAALPSGGYVATWESDRVSGDENYGVVLRIFDSSGAPTSDEIRVNVTTAGRQRWPEVEALSDGRFVVAWSSEDQDGDMFGAYARFFGADGSPSSGEIRLNDLATGNQFLSQLAALDDGGFVGVWASDQKDGSGLGVVGTVFDSAGKRLEPESVLNHYTQSDQTIRSVLGLGGDAYLAAWESKGQDGDGLGVFVRRVGSTEMD